MTESAVDGTGALIAALTPAVYFDASVLIDYWVTDGIKRQPDPDIPPYNAPH